MNILITGITGFIGKHLADYLSSRGHAIHGTARNPDRKPSCAISVSPLTVGTLPMGDLFLDRDMVIHLIHEFDPEKVNTLVCWYKSVYRIAQVAGTKQIFVSSYSARLDAASAYGRSKYKIEQYFLRQGSLVVRPGLVIGNGGIFRSMCNALHKFPLIPVPTATSAEVPFISIGKLCECLAAIIEGRCKGQATEYNLFAEDSICLTVMLKQIAEAKRLRRVFIPVPSSLMLTGVILAEGVGLKLSITSENLKGFIRNQSRIHRSNIALVSEHPETFSEALSSAITTKR